MQVLVCIEQFLKTLFSFVRPDGPQSPERRCQVGKYWALCWGSRDKHMAEKVREAGCEEANSLSCSVVTRPTKGHTRGFLEGCLWEEG